MCSWRRGNVFRNCSEKMFQNTEGSILLDIDCDRKKTTLTLSTLSRIQPVS